MVIKVNIKEDLKFCALSKLLTDRFEQGKFKILLVDLDKRYLAA